MLATLLRCRTLAPAPARISPLRILNPISARTRLIPRFYSANSTPATAPPTDSDAPAPADPPSFYEKIGKPGIRRQVLFVGIFSAVAFSLAAAQTTVETEHWTRRLITGKPFFVSLNGVTNTDLKRTQNTHLIQGLRDKLAEIQVAVRQLPVLLQPWVNRLCIAVMQPYADASEAKRLCWKICLLNAGVWVAWKVKSWQPFMNRRFMHHPLSGLSLTLLTSMFSHQSFIHLLFNCLALESFGAAAYYYLMREQSKAEPEILESTTSYHFLAFFVSAGLFSGLVSHIVSAKVLFPRLVSQLAAARTAKTETWAAAVAAAAPGAARTAGTTATARTRDILPSLGASGAIYAAVTMSALAFPDAQIALFIPPSYPIDIQYGVGALLLIDCIGVLRGWRLFDHWAHLGGAAFGAMYYAYGPTYWRRMREASSMPDKPSPS